MSTQGYHSVEMLQRGSKMAQMQWINRVFSTLCLMIGGLFISLKMPFILLGTNVKNSFEFSAISTFTALILLGVLKWKVIGRGLIVSVTEIVLIGGLAATVAYIVGRMF